MNNKKAKVFIIIGIIIVLTIIIISLVLLQYIKSTNTKNTNIKNAENVYVNNDIEQAETYTKKINLVRDIDSFYSIENFCNFTLSSAYIEKTMYNGRLGTEEEIGLNEVLVTTMENLGLDINTEYGFFLTKAYKTNLNEKNTIYFVEGDIYVKEQNSTKNNIKLTIIEDKVNKRCKIEPYGNSLKSIFNYSDNIEDTTMILSTTDSFKENLSDNYYKSDILDREQSDEITATYLYKRLKNHIRYFTKDSFDALIDNEYREKRFDNDYNEYLSYLDEIYPVIKDAYIAQYSKVGINDYTLYTLIDDANFSYFVKIPNNSTDVIYYLDTYTVPYEGYYEKYNRMSDSVKASDNMVKFINMINTRDYKHAYEVLDDTFKNSYFATLDEFKNYVRNNFYDVNYIIESKITKTDIYYEGYVTLYSENIETANENCKTISIVMVIKDGTDFVMSFNME